MKILFTICGRAGSKGIKNKNLRFFCGKPLAYFTVSVIDLYLRQHDGDDIEAYIVANSDSQELLYLLSNNGLITVDTIERDASLAGDVIGKIAVIEDCLVKMEAKHEKNFDVVVDLDITSPLRTVADLERVINKHISSGADVTTTVAPARRNPYFNQVKKTEHGFKKVIESNYTARQQAPEIFDMNASIYAYKPSYLRSANETGRGVLDGYCEMVEMYDTAVLDLDHENDFELMETVAEYLFRTNPDFRLVYENTPEKEIEQEEEPDMREAFIGLYDSFKSLTETHYSSLSKSPLCSMPLTALIFADCIKTDIQAVLDLKEQNVPDRYVEGIIRGICEQVIEFIYLYRNQSNNPSLLLEYYGLNKTDAELADLENEPNLFKRVRMLIGDKRYSAGRNIHDMSVVIGEDIGTDDEMSLYEAYQLTSTLYHNSYKESFMELIGTVSEMLQKTEKNAKATTALSSSVIADAEAGRSDITVEADDEDDDEDDVDDSDLDFIMLSTILTRFMETYQEIVDHLEDFAEV